MDRMTRALRHVNGHRVADPPPPGLVPTCPKHCDVATPPEAVGGDQYVCVCCGTQFTWKGPP